MPLNIPDPKKFKFVAAQLGDPFLGGSSGTYTEAGETGLFEILKNGIDVTFKREPNGNVSIDLLPKQHSDPPRFIRIFGALYQRIDTHY